MIGVRDLEIRIGPRVLMQGVNFRVDKGDKVGLVGRNGAGKTTLTKIEGTRSSGMPRAVISDGCLWVTWTDANRVQLGWLKITTN